MNKQYTHLSIRYKREAWAWLLSIFALWVIYFLTEYLFFIWTMRDLNLVYYSVAMLLVLGWVQSKEVVKFTDEGVESKGLLQSTRFIKWQDIRQVHITNTWWGTKIKEEKLSAKTYALIRLSSSEKLISRSPWNNKDIIMIPYRQDIFEIIKKYNPATT